MALIRFRAHVSKGSRFRQIYVPNGVEEIDAGDLVEVRLVKKKATLHFRGLQTLPKFKHALSRDILQHCLDEGVQRVFITGSFLAEGADYRDIDVLLIVPDNENRDGWAKQVAESLVRDIPLKFHITALWMTEFQRLLSTCPLTRSMMERCVSNSSVPSLPPRVVDTKRLLFLLMLPEDALTLPVESRTLYDCIRRVITIKQFLEKKQTRAEDVASDVKKLLGSELVDFLKENSSLDTILRSRVISILQRELLTVRKLLRSLTPHSQEASYGKKTRS